MTIVPIITAVCTLKSPYNATQFAKLLSLDRRAKKIGANDTPPLEILANRKRCLFVKNILTEEMNDKFNQYFRVLKGGTRLKKRPYVRPKINGPKFDPYSAVKQSLNPYPCSAFCLNFVPSQSRKTTSFLHSYLVSQILNPYSGASETRPLQCNFQTTKNTPIRWVIFPKFLIIIIR